MLQFCPECRNVDIEKEVEATDDGFALAVCPDCGHQYRFPHLPLYTLEGAPGVGKSTTAGRIEEEISPILFESDMFIDLVGGELSWASICELSLRNCMTIHSTEQQALYVGGMYPHEFTECPETRYFSRIKRCALVCDDDDFAHRLRARPFFREHPARIEAQLGHNQWYQENGANEGIEIVNTTHASPDDVAARVIAWIENTGGL